MGYLDEAIRDHLALQRRRGVAKEELERAEAEALGPVAASDLAESVSERSTEDLDAELESAPEAAPTRDGAQSAPSDGSASPNRDQPTEAYDLADLDELLEGEAEAAPAQPEPMLDEPRRTSTDAPTEPDDEADPLEETPDFLQETPEHDRLWFEQKPPKDFDF